MNIIFLDIDGVLHTFEGPEKETWEEEFTFDSECLENLVTLVKKSNAKIVISSTWRNHKNEKEKGLWYLLNKQLNDVGLEVFDVTPYGFTLDEPVYTENGNIRLSSMRGHEIQKWLDNNLKLNVEKFVILDDDTDMCHLIPYFVRTCSLHGFQVDHLNKALKMFGIYKDEI